MYLMESKDGERMNVPPDKLQEFLDKGWRVILSPQDNKAVVVNQPIVEEVVSAEPDAETGEETESSATKKPRGKRS